MSQKEYISIQEAAKLCGKSAQTIRRAIKAKKIKFKKTKTPQGFNYMISRSSVIEAYNVKVASSDDESAKASKTVEESKKETGDKIAEVQADKDKMSVDVNDFKAFVATLDTLIQRHSEERQNFLRLVDTLHEKIFVLENQINLLQSPKKKWYQVWK